MNNLKAKLVMAALMLSVATMADASSDIPLKLDLSLKPSEPVSIRVTLPTLSCGKKGLSPNECQLGGKLHASGSATSNRIVRYYCIINYSHTDQTIRLTRHNDISSGTVNIPGVMPRENNPRHFGNETSWNQPGAMPGEDVPVRHKGKVFHRGTVNIVNGHGEHDLAGTPPVKIPDNLKQVVLEDIDCLQE